MKKSTKVTLAVSAVSIAGAFALAVVPLLSIVADFGMAVTANGGQGTRLPDNGWSLAWTDGQERDWVISKKRAGEWISQDEWLILLSDQPEQTSSRDTISVSPGDTLTIPRFTGVMWIEAIDTGLPPDTTLADTRSGKLMIETNQCAGDDVCKDPAGSASHSSLPLYAFDMRHETFPLYQGGIERALNAHIPELAELNSPDGSRQFWYLRFKSYRPGFGMWGGWSPYVVIEILPCGEVSPG